MELSRRALLASVPAAAAGIGSRAVPGQDGASGEWEPLGRLRLTGAAEAVVSRDLAYVATVDGFAVVDVADPTAPEPLAERRSLRVADGELLAGDPDGAGGDERDGADGDDEPGGTDDGEDGAGNDTAGGADASGGNDDPEPLTEVLDLSVEGDRLVVPGPANPGEGVFRGFALYDVSDPEDPAPLAAYETDFHIHNSALRGDYCYLVGNDGERNPLVIVDVSGDEPREVGRWSLLDHESRWEGVDPYLWYLHDVTLSGDIAVLAYWNAGTYLVDVSDPAAPEYVGHVAETDVEEQVEIPPADVTEAQQSLPGNDHHARLEGDLLAVGREAWAAEGGDPEGSGGIDLYDAGDPDDIEHLATIEAPPTQDASYAAGEWTTSHNFSFQGGRLYASWYRGGVSIHDVGDPASPTEVARWEDRERAAFWTAHVAGDIVVAPSTPLVPNAPTEGAVYTFPALPEAEADREVSTDDDGEVDGEERNDGERADGERDAADDEPADDAGTEGTDDAGDGTDAEPDDEDGSAAEADADGGDGRSGLGIGAAIAGGAAAGVGVLAWLRLRGSGDGGEDPGRR